MTMSLKAWELISIVLSALMAGMFHGPWVAVSRSMRTFAPEVFLAIVQRMSRNMAAVMTVLMPAAMLSIVPVLLMAWRVRPVTFYLDAAAFALFVVALLVTMMVEVPIVEQMETWTVETLPQNWEELRDRWMRFHLIRVAAGVTSVVLMVAGAIF